MYKKEDFRTGYFIEVSTCSLESDHLKTTHRITDYTANLINSYIKPYPYLKKMFPLDFSFPLQKTLQKLFTDKSISACLKYFLYPRLGSKAHSLSILSYLRC